MVSVLSLHLSLFLCGLLSHPDPRTRDTSQVVLSVIGDRETVKAHARDADGDYAPEARSRAFEAFRCLTIRDLDRLAASSPSGLYPRADTISGWEVHPSRYVSIPTKEYLAWQENNPEFYAAASRDMTSEEICQLTEKENIAKILIAFLTGEDFYGYSEYPGSYEVWPTEEEQRAQTRRQLTKYLVRTSDWKTAEKIVLSGGKNP